MNLEVGGARDTLLAAFLHPRNIGLQHVRKLDIYLADAGAKDAKIDQANFAVRMLLEFLPENNLREFSWHPWQPMSADNLVLLYQKQRKLEYVEGISLDKDPWPQLDHQSHLDQLLQGVRKISIFPDAREVLEYSGQLLRRITKLDELNLHTDFCSTPDHPHFISPRELNDSPTAPGLVSTTLFSHLLPFETCTPLNISKLYLQKVNLRNCSNTYASFINLPYLKQLTVLRCSGADAFFTELCRSTKLPTQLRTLHFKHSDNEEDDGMTALDGFLCLINNLESLIIDFSNCSRMPNIDGIVGHGKNLHQLVVHVGTRAWSDAELKEHFYGGAEMEKISTACTQLAELSLALPDVPITADPTDALDYWLQHLQALSALRTLQFTRFPVFKGNTSRLERDIYVHLLGMHASKLFDGAMAIDALKRLNIVAYGASDDTYNRMDSKNQVIFAKAIVPDVLGGTANALFGDPASVKTRKKAMAVQVSWCDRKYIEPVSDILDLDLGASAVAMPVAGTESPFGDGGWS